MSASSLPSLDQSTADQKAGLDDQLASLKRDGCEKLFIECFVCLPWDQIGRLKSECSCSNQTVLFDLIICFVLHSK